MPYFIGYPNTPYIFGNEDYSVDFPNLVAYADLIDNIKDNVILYQNYYIKDGLRPDQVSYILYGNPFYHWTFFLMNDKLRECGWPLDSQALGSKVKETFPDTAIITRNNIFNNFRVGTVITGQLSETEATIIRRDVNLGQIFVSGTKVFINGETIIAQEDNTTKSFVVESSTTGANAIHHYTLEGEPVDIDPLVGPGELVGIVTYEDYYNTINESLRQIRIIAPQNIETISYEFKNVFR